MGRKSGKDRKKRKRQKERKTQKGFMYTHKDRKKLKWRNIQKERTKR